MCNVLTNYLALTLGNLGIMTSPDGDPPQGSDSDLEESPLRHLTNPNYESFRFKTWQSGPVNPQTASSIIDAFPAEIRPQIWRSLVGDRVLHPFKDFEKIVAIWKYRVCVNERNPQELYDLSRTPDTTVHAIEGFEINTRDVPWKEKDEIEKRTLVQSLRSAEFGHHDCRREKDLETDRSIGFVRRTDKTFSAGQSMLQSCKLFHDEIVHAFWSTNIFSFSNREFWTAFKLTLNGPEADLIKVIDISLHTGELLNPLSYYPEINLKGLKVLHVHFQDSRNRDFEANRFYRTVRAARSLFSQTQLEKVRITVIIDNASHDHCKCHVVLSRPAPPSSLPLTRQECLDFADTLARRIPHTQLIEPFLMTDSPDAKLPDSTSKEMYVCLEGSTSKQCIASYRHKLNDLMGRSVIYGVESCKAKHQCLICKSREGIALLYGASWYCRKPGGCDILGEYTNPHVMPVEKFEKITKSKQDVL